MLSPELTLLIQGRAILADPAKWTVGVMAKATDGYPIGSGDPKAVCWCSMGVLRLLDPSTDINSVSARATRILEEQVPTEDQTWFELGELPDLALFNDRHTHEEVLSFWDRTIAQQWAKEEPVPGPTPDLDTIWPDL